MRVETAHVRVPASADAVFRYIADPTNLPEWATEFVLEAEEDEEGIRAVTPKGPMKLWTRPDPETGVVDILASAGEESPAVFPTRVVELPGGSALFSFTVVQAPGQSEEAFEQDVASLRRELRNVHGRFAA